MIQLSKKQINAAFPKIKKGLEQYLWIQGEVSKRDLSKDSEFQRKFNTFYRVRKNSEWRGYFCELLEINKNNSVDFADVLKILSKKSGNLEASFSSKLIATINPEMPVIDSIVLRNVRRMGNPKIRLPYFYENERQNKVVILHSELKRLFDDFLKTENGKYLVDQFVGEYPNAKITKVKMLDFVLWQTRE